MTGAEPRACGAREGPHRAVHRRASGGRRPARGTLAGRGPRHRARRSSRWPTRQVEDALAALGGGGATSRPSGPPPRRASAARSCAAPTRRSSRETDELALLMTLEMGKALAESRAEIAYAAEFFRWFSEEAVRIHGRYMVNTTGKGRILTMRQPVGPVRVRDAVELPHRDGYPQDRPGDRGGLHDGRQAGPADAAVDARAGEDPRGGGAAGGRAERDHRQALGRGDRAAAARTRARASSRSPAPPRSGAR